MRLFKVFLLISSLFFSVSSQAAFTNALSALGEQTCDQYRLHAQNQNFPGPIECFNGWAYTTDDLNPPAVGSSCGPNAPSGHIWNGSTCVAQSNSATQCANAALQIATTAAYIYDPNGGGTCVLNPGGVNGSSPQCQNGNAACYMKPDPDIPNQPGYQCGTVNGQPMCIASNATSQNGIGTSTKTPGTSSKPGTSKQSTTTQPNTPQPGQTTTTTTTTTTSTTSTTTSSTNGPPPVNNTPGQSTVQDPGHGPAAPYICEDGRAAANIASCDSTVSCPSGTYLAYGVCVNLPTTTTTTQTTTTTTQSTVVDDTTGQTVSQTQPSTTTTQQQPDNQQQDDQGSATGSTACGVVPQCDGDPQECALLLQQYYLSCPQEEHTVESWIPEGEEDLDVRGPLDDFGSRMENAAVIQGLDNFFSIPTGGSCPTWSVNAWVFTIVIDQFCSPSIPWDAISGVIFAAALFAGARIAFT